MRLARLLQIVGLEKRQTYRCLSSASRSPDVCSNAYSNSFQKCNNLITVGRMPSLAVQMVPHHKKKTRRRRMNNPEKMKSVASEHKPPGLSKSPVDIQQRLAFYLIEIDSERRRLKRATSNTRRHISRLVDEPRSASSSSLAPRRMRNQSEAAQNSNKYNGSGGSERRTRQTGYPQSAGSSSRLSRRSNGHEAL